MSSSDLSITPVSPSSFSEAKSDTVALGSVVACDVSIHDWSVSSFVLQLDATFSPESPKSPPQTLEELVLEFEESANEIGNVFPNLDLTGSIEDDNINYSVISRIQIENSRTRKSDTSQDEEEVMVAISPNKLHNVTLSDPLSCDPLSTVSPTSSYSEFLIKNEYQSEHMLDINLPDNVVTQDDSGERIDCLTKYLAKAAHCQTSDEIEILKKAKGAVEKLRQQSKDLMFTHAQLKEKNHELAAKYNKLQSETNPPAMTIEVLISNKSQTPTNSRYLYNSFSLDEDSIPMGPEERFSEPEIRMDEPYENYCDVSEISDAKLLWPLTNDCPKALSSCRLGCVCSSLQSAKKNLPSHCKDPACMFEPECTRPDDPVHGGPARFSIMNGGATQVQIVHRNASLKLASNNEGSINWMEALKKPANEDPKLKQRCFVRLVRLDMGAINKQKVKQSKASNPHQVQKRRSCTKTPKIRTNMAKSGGKTIQQYNDEIKRAKHGINDWKLTAKLNVTLFKIPVKPGNHCYCMEHQKRRCPCLKLSY